MTPFQYLAGPQSRRDILKLASVGALGVSASGWMDVVANEIPAAARTATGRAKNVIVLFMSGGPAHEEDVRPQGRRSRLSL